MVAAKYRMRNFSIFLQEIECKWYEPGYPASCLRIRSLLLREHGSRHSQGVWAEAQTDSDKRKTL